MVSLSCAVGRESKSSKESDKTLKTSNKLDYPEEVATKCSSVVMTYSDIS